MILLLDNFDSFTFNLVDYLNQCGETCEVIQNDVPLAQYVEEDFEAIVLSPGPQQPEKAGTLMEVIAHYHEKKPILGICLGHQALGMYFGHPLKHAHQPMHGKVRLVHKTKDDILWEGFPSSWNVVRYHSLVLQESQTSPYQTIAWSDDEEIMASRHNQLPIKGVQFHPEAYLTDYGLPLIRNWVNSWRLKNA